MSIISNICSHPLVVLSWKLILDQLGIDKSNILDSVQFILPKETDFCSYAYYLRYGLELYFSNHLTRVLESFGTPTKTSREFILKQNNAVSFYTFKRKHVLIHITSSYCIYYIYFRQCTSTYEQFIS